jgi:hypothetical protein
MKKSVFKIGDKVFDIFYGWGVIIEVNQDLTYPIGVEFGDGDCESYTYDGRINNTNSPTLSFTEYTLQGFSQERPKELPKKGQIVWANNRDNDGDWYICYFLEKDPIGGYKVTSHNPFVKIPSYSYYNFITTENPYKDE